MSYRDYTPMLGKKYGRWLVRSIESHGIRKVAACVCDCGTERQVRVSTLDSGESTSCGCYAKQQSSQRSRLHGLSTTSEYQSYSSMVRRCTKPTDQDWQHYGGRGIKVCDRWLEPNGKGFLNFLEDMGEKPHKYEIDRIDVNGNYEPSNCRWATRKEQTRNTRFNLIIEYNGESKCLAEWSEHLQIPYRILQDRLGKLQWTVEKAFTQPFKVKRIVLSRGSDKFVASDVFKSPRSPYIAAEKLGISVYQYIATLFRNDFKVTAHVGQEEIDVKGLDIDLGEVILNLKPDFEQYCRENGLAIGGRLL